MNFTDLLRALRHVFLSHRLRAVLTLLGVMIGAGSVVMLAGLLRSGKESLSSLNHGVSNPDLIQVFRDDAPAKDRYKTSHHLNQRDADVLADSRALGAVAVDGSIDKSTFGYVGSKKKRIGLWGTLPKAKALYRLSLAKGRFLDDEDLRSGARVCVVGKEVWDELFGEDTPLGNARIRAEGVTWNIVGVLVHKPTMGKGNGTWTWNRRVMVPKTTWDAVFSPAHDVSRLFIQLPTVEGMAQQLASARPLIRDTLLRLHGGVKNFDAEEPEGAKQEEIILMVIEMLLFGTGLLSLFVGGVNIMNIMLVTVSERTREIGIRRALGATRKWIVIQFLSEAAAIAFVGGLLGVLGGLAILGVVSLVLSAAFGSWSFYAEGWAIALGMGLATLTGVVFGLMPALRASKLEPVDALRIS